MRGYLQALRAFCGYVADPDYGWDVLCEQLFGVVRSATEAPLAGFVRLYWPDQGVWSDQR